MLKLQSINQTMREDAIDPDDMTYEVSLLMYTTIILPFEM